MMPTRTITLGEVVDENDIVSLLAYVDRKKESGATARNLVLHWLDDKPEVRQRMIKIGLDKQFGAYLICYHLELDQYARPTA